MHNSLEEESACPRGTDAPKGNSTASGAEGKTFPRAEGGPGPLVSDTLLSLGAVLDKTYRHLTKRRRIIT